MIPDPNNTMPEPEGGVPAPPPEADEDKKQPSQATQLVELALDRYRLGNTPDGSPFAVPKAGPAHIVRALRGGRVSLGPELAAGYFDKHRRAPSAAGRADALAVLEGMAAQEAPERIWLRVAPDGLGGCLLDLGRADGAVVHVTRDGWRVIYDDVPALFSRTALSGELPIPTRGGSFAPLETRLNVVAEDWPIVKAWLVCNLTAEIPHPILLVTGEQGAGKTTGTRQLVTLVDPQEAASRSIPRDTEGWAVTAAASWVIGLDNVSSISEQMSDALCKAVTGDALPRRKLYTDSDVAVVRFQRVIAINGIGLSSLRGDLADRVLTVELERIAPEKRREAAAVTMSPDDHAQVLGALCDLTSRVLTELPTVHLDRAPRMIEYARVLRAVDNLLGTDASRRYTRQASDLAEAVIDSDPVALAVCAMVKARGEWTGTPGALLDLITPDKPARDWPKTPKSMGSALRRLAPALRETGYGVVENPRSGKDGRTWTLTPPRDERSGTDTTDTTDTAHGVTSGNAGVGRGVDGSPGVGRSTPPTPTDTATDTDPEAADQQEWALGVDGVGGVGPYPHISDDDPTRCSRCGGPVWLGSGKCQGDCS